MSARFNDARGRRCHTVSFNMTDDERSALSRVRIRLRTVTDAETIRKLVAMADAVEDG